MMARLKIGLKTKAMVAMGKGDREGGSRKRGASFVTSREG
jgi:hypothetical protein